MLKSEQEILNAIFDSTTDHLCVFTTNANPPSRLLSMQEIFNRVFDSTNNALKVQ